MIIIDIELVRDKEIISIFSKGHTEKGNKVLCAAVSTLEYTFLQSVKHLTEVSCTVLIKNGEFSYKLKSIVSKDKMVYNYVCAFYLIGIEMLTRENPNEIKLLKKKN